MNSAEKITIKNFEDALEKSDSEYSQILSEIKKTNSKFLKKDKFVKDFNSKSDFDSFIKSLIIDFLKNENDDLHSDISELRKQGKILTYVNLKIMTLPLKIKIFNAEPSYKNFSKSLEIINKIRTLLNQYEEENKYLENNTQN